jgi:hypothetical protein
VTGGLIIEFLAARKASRRTGRSLLASGVLDAWGEKLLGVRVPVLAGLWMLLTMASWVLV